MPLWVSPSLRQGGGEGEKPGEGGGFRTEFAEMGRAGRGGRERPGEKTQEPGVVAICSTCLGDPKGRCQVAAGYEGQSSQERSQLQRQIWKPSA